MHIFLNFQVWSFKYSFSFSSNVTYKLIYRKLSSFLFCVQQMSFLQKVFPWAAVVFSKHTALALFNLCVQLQDSFWMCYWFFRDRVSNLPYAFFLRFVFFFYFLQFIICIFLLHFLEFWVLVNFFFFHFVKLFTFCFIPLLWE